jgi:hypothetical protein
MPIARPSPLLVWNVGIDFVGLNPAQRPARSTCFKHRRHVDTNRSREQWRGVSNIRFNFAKRGTQHCLPQRANVN